MSPTSKILLIITSVLPIAIGKGLRAGDGNGVLDAQTLGQDLITAMDEVLGCGGLSTDPDHLIQIENSIRPMWKTMPNVNGKLDWKSLRYVAHRYFMQESSLLIRGLEPSRSLNDTETGIAEILAQQLPSHADLLFGGKHIAKSYGLEDAVAFLAALERLVFDAETHLLEKVYGQFGLETEKVLTFRQQKRLLEAYMVHWMLGEDPPAINILLRNRTLLETSFPHWHDLKHFVEGRLRTLEFERAKNVQPEFGRYLMDRRFTFDDAHKVVGSVTKTFQDFWQSECHTMKTQLVDMDKDGTGRVRLSDFYGTGLEKDWRFGESETYLRELGVLDESSPWKGKQVIIPNYLQAASNCIVSSPHYLVCCRNECEEMLGDIEGAIQHPTATVQELMAIVQNITSPSSPTDDPPVLQGALADQLQKVAEAHGGSVPLHGRLFAQWMHYAFPRECPFPHKAGAFAQHTLTPGAFGGGYIASKDQMQEHASALPDETSPENLDDDWMSQWSEEEELFADYSGKMQPPWAKKGGLAYGFLAAVVILILVATGVVSGNQKGALSATALPTFTRQHSHFV